MPTTDTSVPQVVVNKLTKAQYDAATKSPTEFYAVTDATISYNDLSDKPTIPAAQVNSDWSSNSGVSQILNKPNLATVATSGSYNDLLNKPTIPAAQVNSDWNANSGVAQILNKPTIPTVNDATLTITQNGTTVGTFTANQSSNATAALTDTTYSAFTGASAGSAGTAGLVPAPSAGDQGKYLKGDGTWGEIQIPQVRTTLYLTDNIPNLPSSFNIYKDELCSDPITWAELYDLLNSDTGMDVVIRVVSAVDSVFNIVSYEHMTEQFGVIDASNEYGVPAAYYFHADYNDTSTRSKFVVETQSFGGSGLVEMSYGESSAWAKFIAAYQAKQIVYCRASSNSNPASGTQGRKAFMAYVNNAENPTEVEFQYVRSVSTKTSSQPVDQVYVYKLTNASGGTWTVQTRDMGPKLAQGTNTTVSYSNGTYTVSATDTTYSNMTGASASAAGAAGLVPAPAAGDQGKFLQGDGTWAVVQSGPTVVQTTGQSTTDVMSQKAVTDIIGNIATILNTLNVGNGAQ